MPVTLAKEFVDHIILPGLAEAEDIAAAANRTLAGGAIDRAVLTQCRSLHRDRAIASGPECMSDFETGAGGIFPDRACTMSATAHGCAVKISGRGQDQPGIGRATVGRRIETMQHRVCAGGGEAEQHPGT
jgi:hypothetical protein